MSTADAQIMDIEAIKALLPHRYPFLYVDRVTELIPGERIVAVKNVSMDEPFFQGHFPEYAVMPGVLIIEALAQAGAIMMLASKENPGSQMPFFAGIDHARFRKQVVPGDRLVLEVGILKARGPACKLRGQAIVDGQTAAEAEIMAMLADRP